MTGTTAGLLVKVTGAPPKAKTIATTDVDGIFGICVNVSGSSLTCGTSGNGNIAVLGQVPCQFDGATTAGDYVIGSTTSNGKCHDSGSSTVYPTGVAVLGTVQSTNGAGGTYTMFLQTPDVASASGASGGGGKGTALSVNSSATKIQANLNASTPAAGAGNLNITWQASSSGNTTSVSAEVPASGLLDVIGSTRGSILYRGASVWSALTPGTATFVLTSNGAGADPSWQAAGAGGSVSTTGSPTANNLAKFSGAATITNSCVIDNGTNIILGCATPTQPTLHLFTSTFEQGGDTTNSTNAVQIYLAYGQSTTFPHAIATTHNGAGATSNGIRFYTNKGVSAPSFPSDFQLGLTVENAQVKIEGLKTTGAANGKTVVCVDTSTGQLYASTSGVACAN